MKTEGIGQEKLKGVEIFSDKEMFNSGLIDAVLVKLPTMNILQ